MAARKRGLGRGLDALLSSTPAEVEATVSAAAAGGNAAAPANELPLSLLVPNQQQPRTEFEVAELESLAESIKVQGIIQPLIVTRQGNRYLVVAGERRYRAAQLAGLERVPVVVREVEGDRELLEVALVENLQRTDLNPIEEALAFDALREKFGLSQAAIADRVGRSRSSVTNSLRLLKLPAKVQELLRDGSLSAGQARPLLAIKGPKNQLEAAQRAVREDLSARAMERLAGAEGSGKPASGRAAAALDANTAAAAEKLTRALQTRVDIRRRGKRGTVRIHFHSEEELMRIYEQLLDGGS